MLTEECTNDNLCQSPTHRTIELDSGESTGRPLFGLEPGSLRLDHADLLTRIDPVSYGNAQACNDAGDW